MKVITLAGVLVFALLGTSGVASAATISWECTWNETWLLYDCFGRFLEGGNICDVAWTDDDYDDIYTDGHVISKDCNPVLESP